MTELFKNNAISTLASGIGSGDTSCTVQTGDGAKFPAPGGSDFYRITFFKKSTGEIEIAFCTVRSGDGFTTISRGEEGTTPLDLNAGDIVENRTTAGFFTSLTVTDSKVQSNSYQLGTDSGVADVYTIAPTPAISAYAKGQEFWFIPTNNNTGASVLIVSAVASPPDIKLIDGSNPYAGALSTTQMAHVIHDGTNWVLQNPVVQNNSVTLMAAANYAAMVTLLSAAGISIKNTFAEDQFFTQGIGPEYLQNISFAATNDDPAAGDLTFDLLTKAGTDPTATDKVQIAFRNATLTTGNYTIVDAVAATEILIPSGATLGFGAAATDFIYLYALNNAGTIELAVSGELLDDSILHTTVAIDATADSDNILYSTTLRAGAPIRLIGKINIETGVVAGEWDNAPTKLYTGKAIFPVSVFGGEYIKLSDTKAAGTDGGTFTLGAWRVRTLNTEDSDTGGHAGALSSNIFKLDAGTYRCFIRCPAFQVSSHKAKLVNDPSGSPSDALVGSTAYGGAAISAITDSIIQGQFTIASATEFRIEHQSSATKATQGFGIAANVGVDEVYTVAEFWKVK